MLHSRSLKLPLEWYETGENFPVSVGTWIRQKKTSHSSSHNGLQNMMEKIPLWNRRFLGSENETKMKKSMGTQELSTYFSKRDKHQQHYKNIWQIYIDWSYNAPAQISSVTEGEGKGWSPPKRKFGGLSPPRFGPRKYQSRGRKLVWQNIPVSDLLIKVFIRNSLRKQTCDNLHGKKKNKRKQIRYC